MNEKNLFFGTIEVAYFLPRNLMFSAECGPSMLHDEGSDLKNKVIKTAYLYKTPSGKYLDLETFKLYISEDRPTISVTNNSDYRRVLGYDKHGDFFPFVNGNTLQSIRKVIPNITGNQNIYLLQLRKIFKTLK